MAERECRECEYYNSFGDDKDMGYCYAAPPVLSNPGAAHNLFGWDDPVVGSHRHYCRFFKEKEKK